MIRYAEDISFLQAEKEIAKNYYAIENAKKVIKDVYKILSTSHRISKRDKEIFRLHWQEGYTISELAKQYSISKQRIKQIILRIAEIIKIEYTRRQNEV